ncbi:MAG: tRNA-dihydrouridine synthase family protein, partial [Planctomycetota bacterium]|nr:tRNA-dihydrouridine synthase family protein [Planctomycetota bacterium]
ALVRRHPDERCFGAQLAGKQPPLMAEAARLAEAAGADFVDVNLGCPIDDAVRRGFGAALLRRASLVARIVEAMKSAVSIPVTVKLRLGWSSEKPTFLKVALAAEAAGAEAITLHGRSRAQRYRKAADWNAVRALHDAVDVPVIGNGDVSHWTQARAHLDDGDCDAVMIGRWALARPWIFDEFANERTEEYDADRRVALLQRYVELCFETLGSDERGRQRARRFLTFHQDFFARYRRDHDPVSANSQDSRDWGTPPEGPLESWLCRNDAAASEALADWLVDGNDPEPPAPPTDDAVRAVKLRAAG